jgi:hypothetical protein
MDKTDLGLEDVCEVIGYEQTRLLAAWFSNNYLYLPTNFRNDHPLCTLIGERLVRSLIERWAGERVWVPASSEDGRHRRDRVVAEMIAAGASLDAIAAFLECSASRLEKLQRELEARGILVYAGGYRRRGHGRPTSRATAPRAAPEIGVR